MEFVNLFRGFLDFSLFNVVELLPDAACELFEQ